MIGFGFEFMSSDKEGFPTGRVYPAELWICRPVYEGI